MSCFDTLEYEEYTGLLEGRPAWCPFIAAMCSTYAEELYRVQSSKKCTIRWGVNSEKND